MAWMLVYLLSVLGNSHQITPNEITVDVIERNVCYDDCRQDCYTQYILWEWLPYLSRHGVVAWSMAGDDQPPRKVGPYYHQKIMSGGKTYHVRAASYIETRTHQSQDPERVNRSVWPVSLRRGLFQS